MSRIKEIIKAGDAVLVFDVDGVLASLDFGDHNHYEMTDTEWKKINDAGINCYTDERSIRKMKKFLSTCNMTNVYVASKVFSQNEKKFKKEFLMRNYKILENNIYFVDSNKEKLVVMDKIYSKYPELEALKVVLVDDTTDVLNHVAFNSKFSTAHISTFIDL